MTDTSEYYGKGIVHAPMLGPSANIALITSFPTQVFRGEAATTVLTFESTLLGEGGAIMGVRDAQQLTQQNARFANVDAALLLINDSVRVRLPRVRYEPKLLAPGALLPQRLRETLAFAFTKEQLVQLGSATSGLLRVGEVQVKLNKDLPSSARETARLYLCDTSGAK